MSHHGIPVTGYNKPGQCPSNNSFGRKKRESAFSSARRYVGGSRPDFGNNNGYIGDSVYR